MKTILVLTDLSTKAEHAAIQALKIAETLKADMLLFNSFNITEAPKSTPGNTWPTNLYTDFEEKSKAGLQKLNKLLNDKCVHNGFTPKIELINHIGEFGSDIHKYVAARDIVLIVMGSKTHIHFSQLFEDSDAKTVLINARIPVLFIPANVDLTEIKRIVFAVDLTRMYKDSLNFVKDFAQAFGTELIMVHVTASETEKQQKLLQELNLEVQKLNYPKSKAKLVVGTDIEKTICKFTAEVKADLLIMIFHHHISASTHLVSGGHTVQMLDQDNIALMTLPQ